jgi:hypothetical protein
MFKDLNSNFKLSNIRINNNAPLQVTDNKSFLLNYTLNNTLNNNIMNSYDNNLDDSSLFDINPYKNDISSLENPFINSQAFEKTTKTITNERKISKDINLMNLGDIQSDNSDENKEGHEHLMGFEQLKENLLNRKTKSEEPKKHSRFSGDNLRRKLKNIILNYALEFLNKKIKQIYKENIGNGIFKKELLPINRSIKSNTSVEFNINLLYKTLGEIFSCNISCKYKQYFKNHNRIIIDRLLKDKDENIVSYFKKLFNITFLQCIEKFNGSDEIKELEGFTKFSEIKELLPEESEYIEAMENYLNNYVVKLVNKKTKNKTKKREEYKPKKTKKKIRRNN